MTTMLKYNLNEIAEISASGFTCVIPETTIEIINYLTCQFGSTAIISSTLFEKKKVQNVIGKNIGDKNIGDKNMIYNDKIMNKARKYNSRGVEINNEEWGTLRTFQPTKLEQKTGFVLDIDKIRLYFNKLTDKTFLDMREKIFEQINKMCDEYTTDEHKTDIATVIYDLASSNKFYSKIYTELYAELASTYEWVKFVFNEHYTNIMYQYSNIKYVDADKDYNGFCDMNKINEKRKSTTLFLVNLANNGFIPKIGVYNILKQLLQTVLDMIPQQNKKNEVDEITEHIALLFNKEIMNGLTLQPENCINDETVIIVITKLAKCKVKDYPSLSNKTIFKFMDLIEM